MGRPLKIAKSQAVLTITGTSASTQLVTVTETLSQPTDGITSSSGEGIIAGMPFVVATTTGGLTAGTIYYVNEVVSAHTFTVSTTQLSVQPQVLATLTDAGPVTVKATVGLVDYSFDNPNNSNTSTPTGSSQSFGVVGGNTTQYGKQTLVAVAIGVAGNTNAVLSAFTANTNVYYAPLEDEASIVAGTALQAAQANVNGISNDYVNLGFVASVANSTVAISATAANGLITTTGNALTLTAGQPVAFDTTFNGIVANTAYLVATTPNATHMTITTISGGAVAITANASVTANALQGNIQLAASSLATVTNASYAYSTEEAGFIVRQKGKTKYLVKGATSGLTGVCYTANVANAALTANTMAIIATNAAAGTQLVSSLNDYQSELFPAQVAAGSLSAGQDYVIYSVGTTDWTAVGAYANMTGITFTASGTGSGTGTAILTTTDADVIASFNGAAAANAYYTPSNPVVTINNA
jgi:hypothetical protein